MIDQKIEVVVLDEVSVLFENVVDVSISQDTLSDSVDEILFFEDQVEVHFVLGAILLIEMLEENRLQLLQAPC